MRSDWNERVSAGAELLKIFAEDDVGDKGSANVKMTGEGNFVVISIMPDCLGDAGGMRYFSFHDFPTRCL